MLSKSLIRKNCVCSICEKSEDILPGEIFTGVRLADRDEFNSIPAVVTVVCCGKINNHELLFRTGNGRFYFSVRDGWGEEDGVLYGLRQGFCHDFKHPTTAETIIEECDAAVGTYHTWGGAMAYQSRKHTLDVIRSVVEGMKK